MLLILFYLNLYLNRHRRILATVLDHEDLMHNIAQKGSSKKKKKEIHWMNEPLKENFIGKEENTFLASFFFFQTIYRFINKCVYE